MLDTWKLLLASRKAWVGTVTVLAIGGALVLRILDKIPATEMIATMTAIGGVGIALLSSIAWEDSSSKKVLAAAATRPAEAPTQTVNVNSPPESP